MAFVLSNHMEIWKAEIIRKWICLR